MGAEGAELRIRMDRGGAARRGVGEREVADAAGGELARDGQGDEPELAYGGADCGQLGDRGRVGWSSVGWARRCWCGSGRPMSSCSRTKDEDGWVITDASGRTSVPRVWAAGNVADPRAQVVTAAGMGSAAAIAINHDLVDEEVARAVKH